MSSLKTFVRVAVIGCAAAMLAACASVSWKCEIGGDVGQQQQAQGAGGGGVIHATLSGELFAAGIGGAVANMVGINSTLDSSQIAMDISDSSVSWPGSGSVALKIQNKTNNSILAARSFQWVRTGGTIRLSDPGSVDSWLLSTGANAGTHKISYEFQNLTMPAQEGNNLLAVDVYYGSTPQATAAATIPYSGGGRPNDPCVIGACQVQ